MTDAEKAEARKANNTYFNQAQKKDSQVQQQPESSVQPVGSETDLPELHIIQPVSLEEFLNATPPKYIIDNLITENSTNLMYGFAKSGKTYSSIQLAECVAFEEPFLGLPTHCPGKICYCNFDMSGAGFSDRCRQVLRGFRNIPHTEKELLSKMDIIDKGKLKEVHAKLPDFFSMNSGTKDLRYFLQDHGTKFVILDTLSRIKGDADENSNNDMNKVMSNIEEFFLSIDCSVLTDHHAGKTGSMRGASTLYGAVDLILKLEKDEKNENHRILKTDGSRYDEPVSIDIYSHWEKDEEGNPLSYWTDLVEPGTDKSHILKWLKDNGNCATTKSYIAEHATGNKQDNIKIIDSLIASGKLEGIDSGKAHRGKPIIYYRLKERTL